MQSQPNQAPQTKLQAIDVVALMLHALAVTVEVFIRRRIWSRYVDRQAALALLVIPGFGLFWPEHDLRLLMWFLGAVLFACAVVRVTSLRRRVRGEESHSRYNGWPIILSWPLIRRLSEAHAKSLVEPLLVFVAGALTSSMSVPLGAYLMVAAFALMLSNGMLRAYEQQRLMDLKDSLSDQRRIAERFRDGRW